MNPVEKKWADHRRVLESEIAGSDRVICLIAGWQPVDLATGLRWLQSSIYEGFCVRHEISIAGGNMTVRFKKWEYGEEEPGFPPLTDSA